MTPQQCRHQYPRQYCVGGRFQVQCIGRCGSSWGAQFTTPACVTQGPKLKEGGRSMITANFISGCWCWGTRQGWAVHLYCLLLGHGHQRGTYTTVRKVSMAAFQYGIWLAIARGWTVCGCVVVDYFVGEFLLCVSAPIVRYGALARLAEIMGRQATGTMRSTVAKKPRDLRRRHHSFRVRQKAARSECHQPQTQAELY